MSELQDKALIKLFDKFWRTYLSEHPVDASRLGYAEFDEDLTDYSEAGLKTRLQKIADFKKQLAALPKRQLTPEDRIDAELIQGCLETQELLFKKLKIHQTSPSLYLNDILHGLHSVLIQTHRSEQERGMALTRRLAWIPAYLKQARKTLKNPSPVQLEAGILSAYMLLTYVKEGMSDLLLSIRGSLKDALEEARDEAVAEIGAFANVLNREIKPGPKDGYVVGKALYPHFLKWQWGCPVETDQALKNIRKTIKDLETELEKTAAAASKRPWKDVVRNAKRELLPPSAILPQAAKEYQGLLERIERLQLFPTEGVSSIDLQPMPSYMYPWGLSVVHRPFPPMSQEARGGLWVMVPTPEAFEACAGPQVGRFRLSPLLAREGCPGLQLYTQTTRGGCRPIRQLQPAAGLNESWAGYALMTMVATEALDDPKHRLLALHELLWVAYAALADIQLHTQNLKPQEASKLLCERTGEQPFRAEGMVRKLCENPGFAASQVLHRMEWEHLISDLRKKAGKSFNLRSAHEQLLGFGRLAPATLRKLLDV